MNIIITGSGNELHFLIKSFLSKGHNVTVIDKNPELCKSFARLHPEIDVVLGNPSNPDVLKDAGILYTNMVIALTCNDPDNLIICQIAKKIFGIEKTFAIVNDPKNIDIFTQLGLDTVISTTHIISSIIEQKISVEEIINLIPINNGQLSIFEIKIPETSPVIEKTLAEIDLPSDAIIGCILRDSITIIPRGNTVIKIGDKLVCLSLPSVQSKLFSTLIGRLG